MKKNENNKKERTIDELRPLIRKGDVRLIHDITGFTTDYISMVLDGRRKSAKVMDVANKVVDNRDELIKSLKK